MFISLFTSCFKSLDSCKKFPRLPLVFSDVGSLLDSSWLLCGWEGVEFTWLNCDKLLSSKLLLVKFIGSSTVLMLDTFNKLNSDDLVVVFDIDWLVVSKLFKLVYILCSFTFTFCSLFYAILKMTNTLTLKILPHFWY